MTYADYVYYKDNYKGSLSEPLFNFYIVKASKTIDRNVNRKLKQEDITDDVKYVACELCDYLERYEKTENKDVTSYSIDGVSRTFKAYTKEQHLGNIELILDNLPHDLRRYL